MITEKRKNYHFFGMENIMEIKRDYYLNKLIEKENNGLIKIVTGIRRCGKSYLLNELFYKYLLSKGVKESHIIVVALDEVENEHLLNPKELSKYVKSKIVDKEMYYILLDEIQLVDNFVAVLNGFLRITNADTYVTGSNSKFLSTDIVTEFRGRGNEIRVYPLSFSEFSSAYKDNAKAWKDYYTYGGLPLILKQNNDEEKMDYLTSQTNNVYLNDVIERNNVQNTEELSSLVEIISSSIGSLTNPNKLYNTFKSTTQSAITNKTISNYLDYLEEAFLIEKSNRYDVKGKKYIDTPLKYYFTDIGIRNSLLNFRQQEESHIMENIIYLELRRRGFNVDVGIVEIREKNDDDTTSRKQLEIDFIANKGNNKYYIQSALNMPTKEKTVQEQRPLLNINDSFKKIIIVKDDIKRKRDENGIITMGIFDFLLDIDSLDY